MTIIQLAIARSARQMADRVSAGEVTERSHKAYAVLLFDHLARHAHDLTEGEFAAMQAQFVPIWAAAIQVDSWRAQFASEE